MNILSKAITQSCGRIGLIVCLINLPVLTAYAEPQQSLMSLEIQGTAGSSDTTLNLFKSDDSILLQQDILIINEQPVSQLKFNLGYDELAFTNNFIDQDGDELDVNNSPILVKESPTLVLKWFHEDGTEFNQIDLAKPLSFYRGEKLKVSAQTQLSFQTRTGLPKTTDLIVKSPIYTLEIVNPNPARISVNNAFFPLDANFPSNGFSGADFTLETPYSAKQYDWTVSSENGGDTSFLELDPLSGRITLQSEPSKEEQITITATAKQGTDAETYSQTVFTHQFTLTRWWQDGGNFTTLTAAQEYCTNTLGNNYVLPPNYGYLTDALDDGTGNGQTTRDELSANSEALWNEWGDLTQYNWSSNALRTVEQYNGSQYYAVSPQDGRLNVFNSDNINLPAACVRNLDGSPIYNNENPIIQELVIEGEYIPNGQLTGRYTYIANGSGTDSSAYAWGQKDTAQSVVNSQLIITESGVIPNYTLRPEDIGRVIELSVEARNNRGKRGNILTVSTDMTKVEGNLSIHPEGVVLGGMLFPYGTSYPETGFNGAWLKVQTQYGANEYTWSMSGAGDHYQLDEATGTVTFISEPNTYQTVIVEAVGKAGGAAEGSKITHSFTPRYWFETKNTFIRGYSALDAEYDVNNIGSSPELWCSSNFNGYRVPSVGEVTTAGLSSYPPSTSYANDALGLSGRDINGRLFNEWGNLSFYYPRSQFSAGDRSLVVNELTATERGAVISTSGFYYLIDKSSNLSPLCIKDMQQPSTTDIPEITNVKLSGNFSLNSQLKVEYDFTANGGDGVTDKSRYSWGYRGQTVTYPNSELAQLVMSGNNIIQSADVPVDGASGFDLPGLTIKQINSVLELSLLPVNSDNVNGQIVTVDTSMPSTAGNNIVLPAGFVVNGITFPVESVFPQTAFSQAYFRMQLTEGVQNYDWSLENAGDAVTITQDTAEVRFVKPILDGRTITIRATGKAGTSAAGKSISHSFNIKQWVEGSGDVMIRGFIAGDPEYDESEPTSSPELWCEANYPGSRVASRTVFSNALPNGRPSGSLGVDANNLSGRSANGAVWNEWGYLANSRYPNSSLKRENYSTLNYWLDELNGTDERIYGEQVWGGLRYIGRNYNYGDTMGVLCLLNPGLIN